MHATRTSNITLAMLEPWGVMGLACPDEAPLLAFVSLAMPAIAMGNRVIAVPSSPHPLAATDLYTVFDASDVPDGVVNIVTKVGDDMFADNTLRNLQKFGVDTTHVGRVAGKPSGVAPIMVEPSGENSILIVKGANSELKPADVERATADLRTCDLILLQLEVPLETVYAALAFGKAHGVKTLLAAPSRA